MGNPPLFPAQWLQGVSVLYADDDHDARAIIRLSLKYYGALVSVVDSADAALERLSRLIPDVIITDLSMPGRDGVWLLRQIRKHPRAFVVPVVALTAHDRYKAPKMLRYGFDAFFTKPIDPPLLCRTIARMSGRGEGKAAFG